MLTMPDRFVYLSFHLDANRINSRGGLSNVSRLERWHEDGVIMLEMSEVAQQEARTGGNVQRTRKALGYIFSMTLAHTAAEQQRIRQIEAILFPNGAATQNERNDVEIAFNAAKYGRILVTADGDSQSQPGGILGNRTELQRLGVRVMRDSEAVELVRERIEVRDRNARRVAEQTGQTLPDWVDAD